MICNSFQMYRAVVSCFVVLATSTAIGADLSPTRSLYNPVPGVNDWLGHSTAGVAGRVIGGAPLDDTAALDSGSAYIYDAATGNLLQSLNSPTATPGDNFGWSVGTFGNEFLVGKSPLINGGPNSGRAYRYDGNSNAPVMTYVPPAEPHGLFGAAVAGVGDKVVVGAPSANGTFGQVHIYDGASGAFIQTLNNPSSGATQTFSFGWSLAAMGNDKIIVGSPQGGNAIGSAFLFDVNSGQLLQTFNSASTPNSQFGWDVAALGNNVLVSAKTDDTDGLDAGKVYLYDAATGQVIDTFDNPDPAHTPPSLGDEFGSSVDVLNGKVLIGAYLQNPEVPVPGRAYLFDGATRVLQDTLLPPVTNTQFGLSVALFDNYAAVGARFDETGANHAGAVHVFQLAQDPQPPQGVPEPSTLALAALGMLGLAAGWRVRRKRMGAAAR